MRTIKYNVSYEDLISRLPALFAYIENDAYGISRLHKATDSDSGGCYGKIVENIKLPYDIIVNGDTVFTEGTTVTYKTMMSYYYKYKDSLNDDFVKFINKAIGKENIGGIDFTVCDLCPEYVYLADVKRLYNEYISMQKKCHLYEVLKEKNEENQFLCCLCDKFKRMGGEDGMIEILRVLIDKAESVAEEYLKYADDDSSLTLDFNVNLTSSQNDLGLVTPYIEEWQAGKLYCPGDRVYYGETNDTSGQIYVCHNKTTGIWNEETESIEFDYENFKPQEDVTYDTMEDDIVLNGYCDSKLKSLRRNKEYLNEFDETESPEIGCDWLFYYRVGQVIGVPDTLNDNFGNIIQMDGTTSADGDNLAAFGDVIISITPNTENRTLTFTYMLDCHLRAVPSGMSIDDDGNVRYYFSNFYYDNRTEYKYYGVKYEEEYGYEEGGEIDTLIKNGEFDDYISGLYDTGGDLRLYEKYEFVTNNNRYQYIKNIGYDTVEVTTNKTKFSAFVNKSADFQDILLFREDYYNGISYSSVKDINVYIDRGTTAMFEKCIKFSELHTLEDMENYSNGGFFNLQES